jgi:NTE family protein
MADAETTYLPDGEEGMALCLSGGGYRAMLMHLGSLRRLNEFGLLSQLDAISSVSGGSILNGVLATRWSTLDVQADVFTNFDEVIAKPIRDFARADLRTDVLMARFAPKNWWGLAGRDASVTNLLVDAYAEKLELDVQLTDTPQTPRFLFCASNLETGVNWVFGRDPRTGQMRMGDYQTGWTRTKDTTVATAVGASSAFPVTFPPLILSGLDPDTFEDADISRAARRSVALTDGGVYDNMGLEPVWKDHQMVLVCDGGAPLSFEDDPSANILERLTRSYDTAANQALAVRKRWLISMFLAGKMQGTYWGLGSEVENYGLADSKGFSGLALERLTSIRTDLDSFSEDEIAALENHGYALADTAVRKWVLNKPLDKTTAFNWPHPRCQPKHAVADALEDSHERGVIDDMWKWVRGRFRAGWE